MRKESFPQVLKMLNARILEIVLLRQKKHLSGIYSKADH